MWLHADVRAGEWGEVIDCIHAEGDNNPLLRPRRVARAHRCGLSNDVLQFGRDSVGWFLTGCAAG
jgi:hypothetical protein